MDSAMMIEKDSVTRIEMESKQRVVMQGLVSHSL